MEITKDNLGLAIIGLRQCAKEHERDITSTGRIVVSTMCRDVADYLERIQGAVEQRAIDIDKACEWISQYLFEIGFPDDWCRDSKVMSPNGEQRFRKAMGSDSCKSGNKLQELIWHKASEELPKEDGIYIVMLGRNSFVCALEFDAISKQWSIPGYQSDVQYWMPIPEIKGGKQMKELKIGEEIRIRCVKSNSVRPIPDCNKCCFNGVCDTTVMKCQEWKRSDGNNVHFEIVETDHFPDATKMVLTWQDVNKILSASENLSDEIKSGETPEVANLEDYCTEVLRRFKEGNQ